MGGAAFETFLSILLLVVLVIGIIAFATKPFWGRIARYFKNWIEHDRLLEEQQRLERECRQNAQAEMREYCHDDILEGNVAASMPDSAASTEDCAKDKLKEKIKEQIKEQKNANAQIEVEGRAKESIGMHAVSREDTESEIRIQVH